MSTRNRRHHGATFKRPPASNWHRGMAAALQALYAPEPLPADQAAALRRECASVPYRKRQAELGLEIPETASR